NSRSTLIISLPYGLIVGILKITPLYEPGDNKVTGEKFSIITIYKKLTSTTSSNSLAHGWLVGRFIVALFVVFT
ncbi:MAG: hypothetical protein ACR2KZ_11770, partial [Segetibacter sp.]